MSFSQNSQLILRNNQLFKKKIVFISGNIQDEYPLYLSTVKTSINLQKYDDYINFKKKILKILIFIIT